MFRCGKTVALTDRILHVTFPIQHLYYYLFHCLLSHSILSLKISSLPNLGTISPNRISMRYFSNSVAEIAQSLRAGLSGVRIPVGLRLSAPGQTCSVAHPVSCTKGTRSLSRGVKRPGRGANHSPPSSGGIGYRWSYTSTSPLRLLGM
jgi:hypothetical protein